MTPTLVPQRPAGRQSPLLAVAHVAGMIDMVALPLWVGTLMQYYGYSAPQAGLTVTAFLVSVAVCSIWLAPRFRGLPSWARAYLGFVVAAGAFFLASQSTVGPGGMRTLLGLHIVAGLGTGFSLSLTHGSIGRSQNPHRLFAMANVALGLFAIVFLAGMPKLVTHLGPNTLFMAFGAVMCVGAMASIVSLEMDRAKAEPLPLQSVRLPASVWLLSAVVICLTLNQSLMFSFLERIGVARGFSPEQVQGVLIALGLVNLLPGLLATALQHRLSARWVGLIGPLVQATLALAISQSVSFPSYAAAGALYVAVVIFTHIFLFGLLARLDVSGRMVAATPAMMMLGSCTGPAIAGLVVNRVGYEGLGYVACGVSALALLAMARACWQLRHMETPAPLRNTASKPALEVAS